MDQTLHNILSGKPAETGNTSTDSNHNTEEKAIMLSEELKNINLIMDVRLPVRVRIGNKNAFKRCFNYGYRFSCGA